MAKISFAKYGTKAMWEHMQKRPGMVGGSLRAEKRWSQQLYRLRRRGGNPADGHGTLGAAGGIRGMPELYAALNEVGATVAIRSRRKALQATAEELTKVAKQAVKNYKLPNEAKATYRRAIYRRDPKTVQRFDRKTRKWRRSKPMSYRVAVRVGKSERAGFIDAKGRVRKLNRDAFWWRWPEAGTAMRFTRGKGARGRVEGQNIMRKAFDANHAAAIKKGEAAGFSELRRVQARLAAKNKAPK